MAAIERLNTEARKIMTENRERFPILETARLEARKRNRALAELVDREENERVMSSRSRTSKAPSARAPLGPAGREMDAAARRLMEMNPKEYPSIEQAKWRAGEIDAGLKLRVWDENQMTRPWNEKSKVQRHGERQEQETRDQLIDEESEAAIEGRARREVDAAFIAQHLDAIQRRVDNGADKETAIADEMRATVFPAFSKLVKGGKAKAASSSLGFRERFIDKLNSSGGDLDHAIEHMRGELAS